MLMYTENKRPYWAHCPPNPNASFLLIVEDLQMYITEHTFEVVTGKYGMYGVFAKHINF